MERLFSLRAFRRPTKARAAGGLKRATMDVVCIIGDRVYHASGGPCQRELDGRDNLLTLTEAQAHEVGMEPCGFCIVASQESVTPRSD